MMVFTSATTWVLLFAVLLISFNLRDVEASTRECYMCSNKEKACLDPFKVDGPSVTKVKCTGSCAKIKNLDNKEIARICMSGMMKNECKDMDFKGIKTHACFCDGNLCNSATIKGTSVWGAALAAVVAIYTLCSMQ